MIRWLVLAFLISSSQASRPRGIRAEVIFSSFTLCHIEVITDNPESIWTTTDFMNLQTHFSGNLNLVLCLQVASLYNPGSDFRCFDGSNTIPFIQVNDDYCDCEVRKHFLKSTLTLFLNHRMDQTSQVPLPVPMASSFARMLGTRQW